MERGTGQQQYDVVHVRETVRGDGVRVSYKGETEMIKWILILMALLGALMFGLIVATATPNDKEEYEAYERWKERKRNERSD